jgi:hypothetical protein
MNLVERLFADLARYVIRQGSFASAREQVHDINTYFERRNTRPKVENPGHGDLARIKHARVVLDAQVVL